MPRSTHGRGAGEAAPRAGQELEAPEPEETWALGGVGCSWKALLGAWGGSSRGTMGAGDVPQGNVLRQGPRLPAGGMAPSGHSAAAGTARDSILSALLPRPCPPRPHLPSSQPFLGEGEQRIAAAPAASRLCPFLGSPNPWQRTQSLAHTSSDAVSQASPCAKSSSEAPRRGREPRARRDPVGSALRVPAPSRAPAPLPAPCERGTAGLFPSGQPLPGSDFLCIAVTPLPGEPWLSLGSILRLIKTAAGAGGRARMALGTRVGWMRSSSHAARAHSTKG